MKDSTQKSIQQFYKRWFGAMEQEDIEGFLALLADDFYIKMPGQPGMSDIAKLRKGLEQYHQQFESKVDWEIEDIQLFDEYAVVQITERVILINRETKDILKHSGVHLVLLNKSGDSWKLKKDVSSLNQ